MKEPMTDARRKQLYRIKKRKRRKQCIRVALRMAVLCFLVLFAVQKTADLLRVDDSDRMEDAEQSYSGQGGKTRTNTEKTWGVFGKADVLTQEDKLHSIEESDEYPDQLKELAEKNSETIDFVYDYPEMKDKKQTIDLSQEAKTDTVFFSVIHNKLSTFFQHSYIEKKWVLLYTYTKSRAVSNSAYFLFRQFNILNQNGVNNEGIN